MSTVPKTPEVRRWCDTLATYEGKYRKGHFLLLWTDEALDQIKEKGGIADCWPKKDKNAYWVWIDPRYIFRDVLSSLGLSQENIEQIWREAKDAGALIKGQGD